VTSRVRTSFQGLRVTSLVGVRRVFITEEESSGLLVSLLKATIVPRPIAWVSSLSPEGVGNLAPHSFFTVASEDPPVVQFTSIGHKDSLRNVTGTGEFVICLANRSLLEEVNASGTNYPPEINEFEAVGLESEPSEMVAPPRVRESPVAIECRTEGTFTFDSATVVFGRVLAVAITEEVLEGDHPAIGLLDPLARLGRNEWSSIGEVLRVDRIPYRESDD
jgi:flavin reductase (DIM6/NTAB) family NADH-FMN oxidoreductase RutF